MDAIKLVDDEADYELRTWKGEHMSVHKRVSMEETKVSVADAIRSLPTPDGKRSATGFEHGSLQVKINALRGSNTQQLHSRDEAYVLTQGCQGQ